MNYNYSINEKSAHYFFRAVDLTMYQGKPFNLFVTINIDQYSKNHYQRIFSLINRAKNVWIRRYNKKNGLTHDAPRSALVFEQPKFNIHMHWLVYIPFELIEEFKRKLPKWLERYQGFVHENSIDIQHVNPYTLKTISNYLMKGIKRKWAVFFHLQNRVCPQGGIIGQRVKLSRNLGRTALRRSGFKAQTQRNDWITLYPELAAQYEKPANWSAREVIPQVLTARKFPSRTDWLKMLWKKERRRHLASTSINTGSSARLNALIAKQLGYSIRSIENRDW